MRVGRQKPKTRDCKIEKVTFTECVLEVFGGFMLSLPFIFICAGLAYLFGAV